MKTNYAKLLQYLTVFSVLLLVSCGGGGGDFSLTPLPIKLTNGQAAAVVVGQANFTSGTAGSGAAGLSAPYTGVSTSGSQLYVSDSGNNRVLVFNSIPTTNGASASYALGQLNLANYTTSTSATTFRRPLSPVVSGSKLFVSDNGNNRVAIYNNVPTGSPGTIDVVAGQTDKTSNTAACSSSAVLYTPETVSVARGKMVVADGGNNRVLIWNSIPTADGTAADLVLGQTQLNTCGPNAGGGVASASTISYAGGAWTDGTRLVVLDLNNNRVLIWNSFPTSNGHAADLVLGQLNFTSTAPGTSATSLNGPYQGVFVDAAGQLFVTDSGNNRVLVWNSFPTSNDQAADRVLGQQDFTSNGSGTTATTLNYPTGVYVSGTQVFVTDHSNNRVLIY